MKKKSSSETKKSIVEQGYNKVAEQYAALEGEKAWPRSHWLQKVLEKLDPGSSVLDVGCGSGDPAGIEIAWKHRLTGIDISISQIEKAQRNVPKGNFIHGDASSVEFSSASFDAVVCFYTLEHFPRQDHGMLLNRIHHWLKEDGLFLFSTEARDIDEIGEWLGVPMYFSSYNRQKTIDLVVQSGFNIIDMAVENQLEGNTEIPYLWILARKN